MVGVLSPMLSSDTPTPIRRGVFTGAEPALTSFRRMCKADDFPTMGQKCTLCRRRRGRRACPALGESICAACCGTKRLVEINCPADCAYLRSAQSHPPAAVQRQQERDLRFLIPLFEGMTERQHELALLIHGFLRSARPNAPTLLDDDIANASRALAETYETASRGIIYEHSAGTPSAERLSAEFRSLIAARRAEGLQLSDSDVALVIRGIETGAREARATLPGEKTAYLELLQRVLRPPNAGPERSSDGEAPQRPDDSRGTSLIVPGR